MTNADKSVGNCSGGCGNCKLLLLFLIVFSLRLCSSTLFHYLFSINSLAASRGGLLSRNLHWRFSANAVSFRSEGIKWHCVGVKSISRKQVFSAYVSWLFAGLRPTLITVILVPSYGKTTLGLMFCCYCSHALTQSRNAVCQPKPYAALVVHEPPQLKISSACRLLTVVIMPRAPCPLPRERGIWLVTGSPIS